MKRQHTLRDSFRDASVGLRTALREERNMRIHFAALVLLCAVSLALGLNALEWALLLLAAGAVVGLELLNSAIERAVDLAEPRENELAAMSKNLAAGGVLVASVVAVLVGCLVLGPKLWAAVFGVR
ncbi:MAG: Undecaprenol kinase [Firmicutes bacterium]|nr:Undecaprenol kinase [Bacillota bacterium]